MSKLIDIILSEETKKNLLVKHNQACNTNYQIKDIAKTIEYGDKNREIILIEIIFNDYTSQRFFKDSLEIDNFI